MAGPITVAKLASLAADKKVQKSIGVIILILCLLLVAISAIFVIPYMLISSVIMTLNPFGEQLTNDPHYKAIQSLQWEYRAEGELPVYLAKVIELTYTGDISTEVSSAKKFIETYFLTEHEVEIEKTVIDESTGQEITITETETVYCFLTNTEILGMVQAPPFNFTAEDITNIQNLCLDSEGDWKPAFSGSYPMPVQGYISSGYGNRVDPLNGKFFMHPAIDIVPEWHSPIMAIADGEVVNVNISDIYGLNITIKHSVDDKDFYTFSAHLSQSQVKKGQYVTQGEVIGLEGGDPLKDPNPGRTTGHHLHFEIWEKPNRSGHVDPTLYLKL